jgi:hypothetical protein
MDPAAIQAAAETAAVTALEGLSGIAMDPAAVQAAAAAAAAIEGMLGVTPNPAAIAAAQAVAMSALGGQEPPEPVVFTVSASMAVTGILDPNICHNVAIKTITIHVI